MKHMLKTLRCARTVLMLSAAGLILLADLNTAVAFRDSGAQLGQTRIEKLRRQTLYNLQETASRQLMPYMEPRSADEAVFIFDEYPSDRAYLRGVGVGRAEAERLNTEVPHDRRVWVLAEGEVKP